LAQLLNETVRDKKIEKAVSISKKKTIAQTLMLNLIDVANAKGETKRVDSYWNTYHCFHKVKSANKGLYGTYCRNRFCSLCCGIREAKLMDLYLPCLQQWKEPFFLMLTVKATYTGNLKIRMDEMEKLFKRIIR
jgi:hypothetical protein